MGMVEVTVDFDLAPNGSSTTRLLVSSNDADESPYPGGVDIEVNAVGGGCPDNDNDGLCDDVDPDDDNDGMSDAYENANGLNPLVDDAAGDLDMDGLSNLQESQLGTFANDDDSDDDGAGDGDEVAYGSDPLDGSDCPAYACESGTRPWEWGAFQGN